MNRTSTLALLALCAALVVPPANANEPPTEDQKKALRSHCRSDFIKHCSGVKPGGLPALQCLEKNMDKLSSACQESVKPVEAEVEGGTPTTN